MDHGESQTAWTDEPITSSKDDHLGFGLFAEQLANEAVGWTKSPKVVAALTGPWGSGKTSIVNLAIPHLERARVRRLRFDPWLFSTHLDLAAALLSQIAVEVGANRKTKSELAHDFLKYGDQLGAHLSDVLSVAVWYRVFRWLVGILLWLARFLRHPISVRNRLPWFTIKLPSGESSGVRGVRSRVETHLEGLSEPLLVIIDDIDRLTPQEILAVFQLVKATADFPNVTYLLVYDEVAVGSALQSANVDAEGYLEKIVQVNLHAPRPNQTVLTEMIVRSIDAVIRTLPADSWDSERWQQVLYCSHPLFRNVRDIRRFANSLGFHLRLLRGEVDPVDLLALEAIRMFAPGAHRLLGDSKEYFPGLPGTQEQAAVDAAHKRVTDAFPETVRPALHSLLKYLFPRLDSHAGRDYAEAGRCKRAWHEAYFDRYWEFAPGPEEVPDDEIKGLLDRPADEIEGRLIEYVESDRISYVLDRLGFLAEPLTSTHPLIHAVLRISPRLDSHKTIWTGGHDDVRMVRVAGATLPDGPDARKEALAALLQAVPSVSGLVLLFAWEERVRERVAEGGLEQPHLDKAQFDELRPSLVELIQRAARNGILAADPWYFRILYCWKRWSSLEDVRSEVARETATDAELVAYVARGIQTGGSSTGLIHRLSVDAVSEFLDVDTARERLRAVREIGSLPLTAREQVAVDMFLDGREEASEDEELLLAGT